MRGLGALIVTSAFVFVSCGGGDEGGGAPKGGAGGATTGDKGGSGGSSGKGGAPSGGSGGSSTGGAAGGTAGSGGGTVTCDTSTKTCIPPAPVNWTGPIAYYVGTGAVPACPGAFPTKEAIGKASLDEGTASCDCQCDPATGITCGQASIGGTLNCFTIPLNPPKVSAGCTSGSWSAGTYQLTVPKPSGGSCAPKTNNALPTPVWAEDAHRCVGAVPETGTDC